MRKLNTYELVFLSCLPTTFVTNPNQEVRKLYSNDVVFLSCLPNTFVTNPYQEVRKLYSNDLVLYFSPSYYLGHIPN